MGASSQILNIQLGDNNGLICFYCADLQVKRAFPFFELKTE